MLIKSGGVTNQYVNLYKRMKGEKIVFPIFQRGYAWKPEQASQIMDDIMKKVFEESEREIYLLDFIWFDDEGVLKLADGQQRIVTINLLIKAINDTIDKDELPFKKIDLLEIVYDDTQNNKKYQECIHNYPKAPYKKVYLSLLNFVNENISHLDQIIEIIKNSIFIYAKKADTADDAFEIFKQVNTGGKPLKKEEIINTIINEYSQRYDIKIKASMKELQKMLRSYNKFLCNDISKFDGFAIMEFLDKSVVRTKDDFEKFSNYLKVVTGISQLAIASVIEYINRPQLLDILHVMGMKNINVEINRDYLEKIMLPLCLISVVMTAKKSNPGGVITRLYADIIEKIKKEENVSNIEKHILVFVDENREICKIDFNDFYEALKGTNLNQSVKKGLLIMDIIRNNTSGSLNVSSINLEHIYPQKPHVDWAMNGWPVNTDERSLLTHSIGNYMLLNEEINKKIKNKYIEYKIPEYNRIIPRDQILQTSLNSVDFIRFRDIQGSYIDERTQYIANEIKDNFQFGKVLIKEEM